MTPGKERHIDPQSFRQHGAPGFYQDQQPWPRLWFVQIRSGNLGRGLHCGQAGRTAPSPGPLSLSFPTSRPLLTLPLLLPLSLPSPQIHTKRGHLSPPKSHQLYCPPHILPTSQEHAETAGQEAPQDGPHLPFWRSLLSPARGGHKRGRRGAGAAAAAAGLHVHASQLSRERRKKGARQGSTRAAAAALSTAPLWPGFARRQRLLPSRRLLPRRAASPAQLLIQPLPLTQGRRDTVCLPPPRLPAKISLRAVEPRPLEPPPLQLWKKAGVRAGPLLGNPGRCAGGAEESCREKAVRRHIPTGLFPGPPRGGREATSNNIGAGVAGTTFCGSAGPPPSPLFVPLLLAQPGGVEGLRRLPPGPGLWGRGRPEAAELQAHA